MSENELLVSAFHLSPSILVHLKRGMGRLRVEHPLRQEDLVKQVGAFAHGEKILVFGSEQKYPALNGVK